MAPLSTRQDRPATPQTSCPKPTTLKTLHWSPWYRFSAGNSKPAEAFHPKPQVAACLMVAAKLGPPLVQPCHRHLFPGLPLIFPFMLRVRQWASLFFFMVRMVPHDR
jgi:hypothetical protein